MTIKDTENKIGQLFSNTLNITKKENASDLVSSFAEEFHRQLASISNTNPNKPAATETSESDTMVEEFKNTLGTKGALTFFQDYNNEKIEKMIEEKKAELMESKNNTYRELLASMTPADVTEDVRRTLAELHNRGYKLALGSSSKNAKFILEKVQLLDAFDAISDGTNITKSKPDPEVFLRAAEFLGEKPEDCYVVEDAYAGIDAAKSAGMQAVGIGIAAGYAAADVKIQSFGELLTLGA
mgnify:CR=1 FL=1